MNDLSREIAVKPIIKYPREAQVGKTYLMTIDLQLEEEFEWQYEEEEYPIYCSIDSNLFESKPVGEPVIVLHRFGGSYGEAKFSLTAIHVEGDVKVTLTNRWGIPFKTFSLPSVVYNNKVSSSLIDEFEKLRERGNNIDFSRRTHDMRSINQRRMVSFVEENISRFHQRRIESLGRLNLENILKRKNPYLFMAKNIATATDFVSNLLDAYLSSSDETLFGIFLEELAIFVCETYGGERSSFEGIDLEFKRNQVKYIISIKNSPNWGNSAQIRRMIDNFRKAKKELSRDKSLTNIVAINGCLYGLDNQPDKGEYLKLCGQRFWEFISVDEMLYTEIVESFSYKAKENNEQFQLEYNKIVNEFTKKFIQDFCDQEGNINWQKIIQFNSSKKSNK